jgi:ribosomal protein L31
MFSEKDICTLEAATGDCDDYKERWYYNTAEKRFHFRLIIFLSNNVEICFRCHPFYYGGCGGNKNNFLNEDICNARCHEQIPTTSRPVEDPFTQGF